MTTNPSSNTHPLSDHPRLAKRKRNILAIGLAMAAIGSGVGNAGEITYNFDDGTLDGLVVTSSGGFSYNVSAGKLNVSGAWPGSIAIDTPFVVPGDFTATVDATYTSLPYGGDLGLVGARSDVYFVNNADPGGIFINSNLVFPPIPANGRVYTGATSAKLRITRVGDTVTTYCDSGGGFVQVATVAHPLVSTVETVTLFLDNEANNSAFEAGSFDNFTIVAASVPEPGTTLLGVAGVGVLTLRRRRASSV